jgi:hypothetical protein
MSGIALTEISYYMRIAIDINKKVGGTRAYGNFTLTQRPRPILAIDSQSSRMTFTSDSMR